MMMIDDVLNLFRPHTHSLTLVSDPDRFLSGERVMLEFAQRDFQVIQEDDPVFLRHRLEDARPFKLEHPVIVITNSALEDLPYDIYQPAYRLSLSLHQFFPNLVYPVLQTLTLENIEKLASCQQPVQPLSRQKTIDYLLNKVFDADPVILSKPPSLIAWLNNYHHQQNPLPELLQASLIEQLHQFPQYLEWDLDLIIRDGEEFQRFVQQQWQESISQSLSGLNFNETRGEYSILFNRDTLLQDLVPGLVRLGTIQPLRIEDQANLPNWAKPGVTLVDVRLARLATLLDVIESQLNGFQADTQTSWNTWKEVAVNWSELTSYFLQADLATNLEQKEAYLRFASEIDALIVNWLSKNYTALGVQRLPTPHHVHHIPHFLAYQRNLGKFNKVVLLVLDGLSSSDWQVIYSVWSKRYPDWKIKSDSLLAQVPTITAVSRYALISGMRPADFASDLENRVSEARAWQLFWSREGIAENACSLLPLQYDRNIDQLPELQDPKVNFWCLIDDTTDKLAHNATLGAADQQASLRLWLDPANVPNSLPLEKLLDLYLDQGYALFIASDHGHVEAKGIGQPSEGLLAQTRGKRARIYMDRLAALRVQSAFANTILWDNDGILPDKMTALMPSRRDAFAPIGEVVVTHGGISIDEAIVPFIQITKESK